MGYHQRKRHARQATRLETLVIVAGSLLFVCLFTWIFAQPGMWNFGNLLAVAPKSTATTVPTQTPTDSGTMIGLIGVAGLFAVIVGGGGLMILVGVWFLRQPSLRKETVITVANPMTTKPNASNTQPIATTSSASSVSQPSQVRLDSTISHTWRPRSNYTRPSALPVRLESTISRTLEPEPVSEELEEETDLSVEARRVLRNFERSFFWTLRVAVKDDYYIFPQIPLRQLVTQESRRNVSRELWGMMRGGIVDFILASPSTLEAVVAFEFDDPSHNQADARARDRRKELFFQQVGIPLLRFQSRKSWDANLLRQQIADSASLEHKIDLLDVWERDLFRAVCVASDKYFVFPKVSLRQIIRRASWMPPQLYKTLKLELENEVVDFVLAHPKYLGTLAVIESGDPASCNEEKENLLKKAGIPLLHLYRGQTWGVASVRREIAAVIRVNGAK